MTRPIVPPAPCSQNEHRQFDFWIGEWEVRDASGKLQGHNTIEPILGGCVLKESWRGTSGNVGESFNLYDKQAGHWHQSWVDNDGTLLKLDGGLHDNAMVMQGPGKAQDGSGLMNRITWTPLEDGRVKQHWQTSHDGGETWSDAFVGFYARHEAAK